LRNNEDFVKIINTKRTGNTYPYLCNTRCRNSL